MARTPPGTSRATQLSRSERWQTVLLGPFLIFVFAVVPFVVAGLISQALGVTYADALKSVTTTLEPIMARFYDVLGVLATVLVALAAATNLGRSERDLGERARVVVLASVAVCALLIALMASATISVAVLDADRWLEVGMIFVVSWVCLLVALVVTGVATLDERANKARNVWKLRKRRARAHGVVRADRIPRRALVASEIALWVAPFVLWLILGMSVIIGAGVPNSAWGVFGSIVVLIYYGNAIVTLGWRVTADLSDSPRARRWIRWGSALSGVLISVIFGVSLMPTASTLGWSLIGFSIIHACLLAFFASRNPLFQVVERAATVRSLRRAHANKVLQMKNAKAAPRVAVETL